MQVDDKKVYSLKYVMNSLRNDKGGYNINISKAQKMFKTPNIYIQANLESFTKDGLFKEM
jgi:hypothetical protein